MILHAIGWLLAAILLCSVSYSVRFHFRNYARMRLRDDPISHLLRARYLRNTRLQPAVKWAGIAALVVWLTGSQNSGEVFSDAVLRAVFTQSESYKSDVLPLLARAGTDEDRQLALRHWGDSV